ncbi:hypothetical protein IU443_05030 [Nocardia farcinica]|nr:hypothetical protein [Nocardia farcinica]AXK85139.1 hypothetical protein DXT66_05385 [Nocardia farcinica]MBA4855554.1 hypothetical protein [Nocardia farcinica]MBC9818107.1 hypothetical protein [Nocardia farcinica]MBF6140300.1 hypothetical protein [Nocardia farcinica]MBF6231071.1 hypothetical protein [Nocardia farcinica]
MSDPCPTCAWPAPMLVSTHGSVRYLRCVCGQWVVAHPGGSTAINGRPGGPAGEPGDHFELIPLPES